ncbi:MAG: hypothetical protein HONBIEJF_02716 [Fimbriimonadaceae bacterium]|nr:hypothetical protein [Fimbriimonadaceae bacterium]
MIAFLGLSSHDWWELLRSLVIAILAGTLFRALFFGIGRLIFRLGETEVDHSTRTQIRWSSFVSGMTWSLLASNAGYEFPQPVERAIDISLLIANVVASSWLIVAIWELVCDLVRHRKITESKRATNLVIPFAKKFGRATVVVITIVVLLSYCDVNVTGLVAGLGLGGLLFALAAKDSVENIFGSITVLFDMPFAIGDWVTIEGANGVVEEINLRSTRIRTFDDSLVTLPNSNLIKASVENWGQRRFRRLQSRMVCDPATAPEAIEKWTAALREEIPTWPSVVSDKSNVALFDISDVGAVVQLTIYFDIDDGNAELRAREAALLRAMNLAANYGVELISSFPRSARG